MKQKKDHQYFMRLAMKEALKARGQTSPNPMVGALVVKSGKILSKGDIDIPELRKEPSLAKSFGYFLVFVAGLAILWLVKFIGKIWLEEDKK